MHRQHRVELNGAPAPIAFFICSVMVATMKPGASSRSSLFLQLEQHKARRKPAGCFVGGALIVSTWLLSWPGICLGDTLAMPINGSQISRQRSTQVRCALNLFEIGMASHTWATDNLDHLPPSLQVLTNELGSPAPLFCPANFRPSVPTNWADVNWAAIDYVWNDAADPADPSAILCTCRIHENAARVDGSTVQGGFRPGWPLITAGLKYVLTTPGEDVRFEFRVSSNAFQPQFLQWRREHVERFTNVVKVENPDFPNQYSWVTNVLTQTVGTNMPGETNAFLLLTNVQAEDAGLYAITISNQLGTSSTLTSLRVGPEFAGYSTNDTGALIYCLNNLKMFSLLFAAWAADHNDQQPPEWATLTNLDGSFMFGWPESLYCRADKQRTSPPDWSGVDFNSTSYELLTANATNAYAPYCRCRIHGFYVEPGGEVMRAPKLNAVMPLTNGTVQPNYKVFADRTNILEASSDLLHWTTLKTHFPTNGEFEFIDNEKLSSRFYRLRMP
jgi:hypothetical protein